MCSTQSPSSFPNVAFEVVPVSAWLTMALSCPFKEDCLVLPLSILTGHKMQSALKTSITSNTEIISAAFSPQFCARGYLFPREQARPWDHFSTSFTLIPLARLYDEWPEDDRDQDPVVTSAPISHWSHDEWPEDDADQGLVVTSAPVSLWSRWPGYPCWVASGWPWPGPCGHWPWCPQPQSLHPCQDKHIIMKYKLQDKNRSMRTSIVGLLVALS